MILDKYLRIRRPAASAVLRFPLKVNGDGSGCEADSRRCFDGASEIKKAPMITRTATQINSPRAIMLRHAWLPMSAA